MLIGALLLVLAAQALPAAAAETVVRFDLRRPGHAYLGLGANIWPGDAAVERAYTGLGMTWARLWAGCPDGAPGAAGTREEFDAWWRRHPGMPGVRVTAALLARHRVQTVLCIGSPPAAWLGPQFRLRPEYHGAFARLWGSAVAAHTAAGVRPAYVELYNEPDGFWGIHVEPDDNAALIRLVRAELDARGFRDVGICGPGTAHADWGPAGDRYVDAMGPDTLAALAAWSNHAWEWNTAAIDAEGGQSYLRTAWPSVMSAIRRKDPAGRRPVLVTEFATKAHAFHGRVYVDQGAGRSDFTASDTTAYAVRVVENALHLLNGGAGALIVWEGADQPWSNHEWGLMTRPDRGSRPRPVYHALRALFPHVPVGARVLAPVSPPGDVTASAFRRGRRLVIALANGTAHTRAVRLEAPGAGRLALVAVARFHQGAAGPGAARVAGTTITASLPADSTLTCVCAVGGTPSGPAPVGGRGRRSRGPHDTRP